MKIKTFIIILISYTLLFGACQWYVKQNAIARPIFLKHLIEKSFTSEQKEMNLELMYITNRNEPPVQIQSVQSKKYPNLQFQIHYQNKDYDQHLYSVNRISMSIYSSDILLEDIYLNDLTFAFSNGITMTENIGKVSFRKQEHIPMELFSIIQSGSSSNGESYSMSNILKPITIRSFLHPFQEEINPFLQLNWTIRKGLVNGGSIETSQILVEEEVREQNLDEDFPIEVENNHSLILQAKVDKEKMVDNDIYFLSFWLTGEFLHNGRYYKNSLLHIGEEHPYLTTEQIKSYISSRKGREM